VDELAEQETSIKHLTESNRDVGYFQQTAQRCMPEDRTLFPPASGLVAKRQYATF
jgi:hypothetical protein